MNLSALACEQETYGVRLLWGERGAMTAATRGDIVIVVDVLSFCTTVAVAVSNGAVVIPCRPGDDVQRIADEHRAVVAVGRDQASGHRSYSLSPASMLAVPPSTRVVLPSPNGAACACASQLSVTVLAGAIVNVDAVCSYARMVRAETGQGITVVPCGERWQDDGSLRVAIEDLIGAGAFLVQFGDDRSPEADVAIAAWENTRSSLHHTLRHSVSGRELCDSGYAADVAVAASPNSHPSVPLLRRGAFRSDV